MPVPTEWIPGSVQKNAIRIIEYWSKNPKLPYSEVVKKLGLNWGVGSFEGATGALIDRLKKNPGILKNVKNGQKFIDLATKAVQAARSGTTLARMGVAGGSLMSSLMNALRTLLTGKALIYLGIGAIVFGGLWYQYYYKGLDDPVQPGPNYYEREERVENMDEKGGVEPFGIFEARGYVLVGRKDAIEFTATCNLVGWGLDCDKLVRDVTTLNPLSGSFDTWEEVLEAYCNLLDKESIRLIPLAAAKKKGKVGGVEYNITNAPSCP